MKNENKKINDWLTERTWHLQRRRELFDLFAAKQGFNALVPENWYPIDPKELNTDKVHLLQNCLVLSYSC